MLLFPVGLGAFADERNRHGRDNKLYIWQIRLEDEKPMSRKLPIEDASAEESPRPKILHELDVNTLNFCEFAMCYTGQETDEGRKEMLIATPGLEDGHINVISLPSENRVATIRGPNGMNTGMVMALGLIHKSDGSLRVLAGYESGHACIWTQQRKGMATFQVTYLQKTHAQPILSIGIAASQGIWFTSGADAIVARHPFDEKSGEDTKTIQTKHAGQQGLAVRNDEKVFATAGWDGRMRVYSVKGMKELAVLRWHGEGCYAVAFAEVEVEDELKSTAVVKAERELTVAERREEMARTTHWLAAGSKDGKVSLWEIY